MDSKFTLYKKMKRKKKIHYKLQWFTQPEEKKGVRALSLSLYRGEETRGKQAIRKRGRERGPFYI
jgi:hypothetical protein